MLFEPALFNSGAACAQHALSLRAGSGSVCSWRGHIRCGGHQVRELASSPLAQVAPLGGVGADTGLMESTRQTGAYQTACDHNQQWRRTTNAIIYKNIVQDSFSFSLLRLFTPTPILRGSMEGLWPCRYSRQQDVFIVPRASLLFMLYCWRVCSVTSCSLFPTNCTFWREVKGDTLNTVAREEKKQKKLKMNRFFFRFSVDVMRKRSAEGSNNNTAVNHYFHAPLGRNFSFYRL